MVNVLTSLMMSFEKHKFNSLIFSMVNVCSLWNHELATFEDCCLVAKSDSLQPHRLQHARLPCPSPSPGVCSSSCPLSQWRYPTISSSVARFSSYLQPFPASGSFPMSRPFASGGQSIGASVSVLPMNIQGWFPLGWTVLICCPRDSRESSPAQCKSISSSALILLYCPTLCDSMGCSMPTSLSFTISRSLLKLMSIE